METEPIKYESFGIQMRKDVRKLLRVKAANEDLEIRDALEQAVLNWVNPKPCGPLPHDLIGMVLSLLENPRFDDEDPRIRIASRSLNVAREILSDFVTTPPAKS